MLIVGKNLLTLPLQLNIASMITFWNYKSKLEAVSDWAEDCWVQATCPTAEDQEFLTQTLKVPEDFLEAIKDTDEQSRYDFDDGWAIIILRVPFENEDDTRTPHITVPLGIILNKGICITVCNFHTQMMSDFLAYQQKRRDGFTDSVDLTFRLFLSSAVWYLKSLRQINVKIEEAKRNLDKKIDNADLVSLSRLQDSLTYFLTAIRGNETLLAKLKFKLPVDELDADLIEDVNIEMNQARETTSIYSDILDSTMDTYANVINNNMSMTMKQMTSLSLLLMFPTLVASIFGMNVISGLEGSPWAFPAIIVVTVAITLLLYFLFRRKTWL